MAIIAHYITIDGVLGKQSSNFVPLVLGRILTHFTFYRRTTDRLP